MVDNLLEIEIAYSMLKDSVTSGDTDPLDVHFQKLKANIMVSTYYYLFITEVTRSLLK